MEVRSIPTLTLTKIPKGHAARRRVFYSNEVVHLEPHLLNTQGAALVWCLDSLALYSKHHLMACRITALEQSVVLKHGLQSALNAYIAKLMDQKKRFYFTPDALRLAHGDHDGLPGLAIDCYDQVSVVSSSAAVSDLLLPWVVTALITHAPERPIFEKSQGQSRAFEKLPPVKRWQHLPHTTAQTTQFCGKTFHFDLEHGQKTGLFLDQRCNLEAWRKLLYARTGTVLDIGCYVGAWSVIAAEVCHSCTLVDASETALALAKKNLAPYACTVTCISGDMFEVLEQLKKDQRTFDHIIVDPPAFAKSKKDHAQAMRAYARLFRLALSCLNPEGLFVACSCSRHITEEDFASLIHELPATLHLLHRGGSSPCHTQNLSVDTHDYLKCWIMRLGIA